MQASRMAIGAGLAFAMLLGAGADTGQVAVASGPADDFSTRCSALAGQRSPIFGEIRSARRTSGAYDPKLPFISGSIDLPAHCDIEGAFPARKGTHGQTYAIRYHLRLPENWNGRFLFQGGGGTNGVIGDAVGWIGVGNRPALLQGFAVVSQDSGHDNAVNKDPHWGGVTVYGTDPQARADYGHASLPRVASAAKALIARFYGTPSEKSYFYGCSKGGQEGMAFAQRYPDMFDGIVAAAPGFSLPRAAVAQAWDTQTFARLWPKDAGKLTPASFTTLFSAGDFRLVHEAVGKACDGLDGLRDGVVGAFAKCTRDRVLPELRRFECRPGAGGSCLAPAKIAVLDRSLSGPRDARGKPIYTDWPWDLGIGTWGWSLWKLGSPAMPSLNILTGGASLPSVFMVPPRPVSEDPQSLLDFQMAFRFPADARAIYATAAQFPRSPWQDIAMRSPNLDGFRAHGGKLIVPHGVSDPVFSINDTIAWRNEVNARYKGHADAVARVFPVPGMAHCFGGPATSQFDAFGALVEWVEKGKAPDQLNASAGKDTPWPGRTRPLCSYPKVARYSGKGSIEDAANFSCKAI